MFVADLQTNTITAESRSADGSARATAQAGTLDQCRRQPCQLHLAATDLGPRQTWFDDVFVRDRASDLTQLASTSFSSSRERYSDRSTMSDDGRYVAFDSTATNLVRPTRTATCRMSTPAPRSCPASTALPASGPAHPGSAGGNEHVADHGAGSGRAWPSISGQE